MHAFGQHIHSERAVDEAAQRRGDPHLIVISRAGIERDDELHVAHARRECLEIKRQIDTAALFARLDHAHAMRARDTLFIQRHDGRERSEYRVAVVGAAAAVQFSIFIHGCPRAETCAPSGHLGLLVEVAVNQNGFAGIFAAGGRNIEEQHRRAPLGAHHLQREAGHMLRGHPFARLLDGRIEETVFGPVAIEAGRLRGQLHVFDELRDDVGIPLAGNIVEQFIGVQMGQCGDGVASGHDRFP